MSDENTVPQAVFNLIQRYEAYRQAYLRGDYNETQLRREFVDPLFRALGWDVDNNQGFAEAYKEVVHEQTIKFRGQDTNTKFIDYSFRLGGVMKFIVETKKPSVKIAEDAKYTGGLVLTYPKETVLPYLKCYEPSGNEIYCIFVPKESTGRNNKYFAVVDGKIVAAGFLLEESTANVYQLIRQSNFVDYEPNIVDIGTGGELKDLIWNAQNGTLNIRTTKAGSGDDYKGWLVINYCYISY